MILIVILLVIIVVMGIVVGVLVSRDKPDAPRYMGCKGMGPWD